MSWGRVPFIPFKNNPQEVSDLFMYKTIIDALDRRLSDTQNTFDESVELIYILKGYEGENLKDFMHNLKYYKAINVDGEGSGVDTIKVEVPVDAVKEYVKCYANTLSSSAKVWTSNKINSVIVQVVLHSNSCIAT